MRTITKPAEDIRRGDSLTYGTVTNTARTGQIVWVETRDELTGQYHNEMYAPLEPLQLAVTTNL